MRWCVVLFMLVALTETAHASEPCGPSDRPLVELKTVVKPPDQVIADTLQAHLGASLAERGIDLCLNPIASRKPVGRVLLEVRRSPDGPVTALIRIGDHITDKRVEREMVLTTVPEDTRAGAVAASADELLRASWAELMLTDAPTPRMHPPDAIINAVTSSVRPVEELEALKAKPPTEVRDHTVQAGALAVGSLYPRMKTIGPNVMVAYWHREQLGIFMQGRFAFSAPESGPNGSVSMRSQGGGVGVSYAFWPVRSLATLAVEAEVSAHRFELLPTRANESVVETALDDWTMEVALGPRGFLTFEPIQLTLGLSVRTALRPVNASDTGQVVLSNKPVGGECSLGLLVVL